MINTRHIEKHEVILAPVLKDYNGKSFKQAVPYKDIIDLENNNNIKNTKVIQEILKNKYPNNKKNDFNYSFYLNPKYSDIAVLDFDDYKITLDKIKFICQFNSVFNTYWKILEKELFNKTFTVTTPSGGKHYYMRIPNKTILERIVAAIDPADFLDETQLQTFIERFEIKVEGKKRMETNRKIKIDFIPNGLIHGPGILMKNVQKRKGEPPKDRYYKITRDVPLIEIDNILKPILESIFKPKKSKSKKAKSSKSNYELLDTKLLEIINKIDEIEKLQITDSSKAISKLSETLSEIKTQFTTGNTNIFSKNPIEERQYIEEWFNEEKENLIKEEYFKTPETEYIYNILYRQNVAASYKDRVYDLYPKLLLDNVLNSKPGERSEAEMAFITNLKVRNFEDSFIKYLVYKSFPKTSRCIEDPSFLNQALQVATALSNFPENLNKKEKSWIQILQSICLIRKIDFSVYEGLNSDKARVALETLFNWASVTNNFTITLPLKELTLISLGRLNFKSLRRYLLVFEDAGFIEKVSWEKDEKGQLLFPKGITLYDLTKLKNLKLNSKPRYFPQDGHQNLAYTNGIGIRGFLIIDLLRKYGNLNRTDIYSYFTEIKDFRRVTLKCLSTLKSFGILVSDPNKNYSLNDISYNQVYEDFALNGRKERNSKPLEKKVENYQQDFNFHQKKRKAS